MMYRFLLLVFLSSFDHYAGFRGVSAFDLTILHTNDVHARVEQTNQYSAACSDEDATEGKCYGGVARIKSKVDEIRRQKPNQVLLLDGGDQSVGTQWFFTFGATIMPTLMNMIGYDAMALGNHEFDSGVDFLRQFVDNTTFDVLSCNLDLSRNPDLKSKIKASTILTVGGERIGIVGYTTAETETISRPGTIGFKNEIDSVKEAVNRLKGQGINKIVAVGHAGYSVDKSIGAEVPDIDVIVGGHTNTFLYTGTAPSIEKPEGPYPTVVKGPTGKNVLVVQDYAYGKYLGHLEVQFDNVGEITAWSGNPILLDNSVTQDPTMLEFLKPYQAQLEVTKNAFVGTTTVFIVGDRSVCRKQECNMGNMLTDAMVKDNRRRAGTSELANVGIAFMNGGGIRSSMDKGNITVEHILSVQPFRNTVDVVELTGDTIYKALEYCASRRVATGDLYGGFLQVSGMKIVYDMRRPVNERVVDVKALCAECRVPVYKDLNKTHVYKVIMSTFIAEGGDGYRIFKDNIIKSYNNADLDSTILRNYISHYYPIAPAVEGRIRFLDDTNEDEFCLNSTGRMTSSILVLLYTLLLLATGRLL